MATAKTTSFKIYFNTQEENFARRQEPMIDVGYIWRSELKQSRWSRWKHQFKRRFRCCRLPRILSSLLPHAWPSLFKLTGSWKIASCSSLAFCISFVFNFCRLLQSSQEKLKTALFQELLLLRVWGGKWRIGFYRFGGYMVVCYTGVVRGDTKNGCLADYEVHGGKKKVLIWLSLRAKENIL